MAIGKRTLDMVKCGEQQPEADHQMQEENTVMGLLYGQSFRSLKKTMVGSPYASPLQQNAPSSV